MISSTRIDSIRRSVEVETYDLQTRNHNFIVNGHVVHNCLIFQESVMELANKVAGFPMAETDEVRRAIMKRSISGGDAAKKKAQELEDSFVGGAMKNGVPKEIAEKAYQTVLWMSGYGFNKCFTGENEVCTLDKDGTNSKTKIVDIKQGDIVLSYDETLKKSITAEVVDCHKTGYNEIVEVELTSGEKFKCTENHKFRTAETREMLPLWLINKLGLSIVVNSLHTSATGAEKQSNVGVMDESIPMNNTL